MNTVASMIEARIEGAAEDTLQDMLTALWRAAGAILAANGLANQETNAEGHTLQVALLQTYTGPQADRNAALDRIKAALTDKRRAQVVRLIMEGA